MISDGSSMLEVGSSLTPSQISALITIERTGAALSMLAILLTLVSFGLFSKLRTMPNHFLALASLANAGASVASMMGYDGVDKGQDSSLCQAQAFIFEWFMQSDPWWSCAMAVNVLLVFFFNVNPVKIHKRLWIYCLVCFGGPLIPAVILICLQGDSRGAVYGDATLWCWIGPQWSLVRLYAYYIPIWLCLFTSLVIYVLVGCHVFRSRNQLRQVAGQMGSVPNSRSRVVLGSRDSAEERLTGNPDGCGTIMTELQVTSGPSPRKCPTPIPLSDEHGSSSRLPWVDCHVAMSKGIDGFQHFEVVCQSSTQGARRKSLLDRLHLGAVYKSITQAWISASLKLKCFDAVKRAYLRTSVIFGLAVIITWVPSSFNRLYSLQNDGRISFGYSVASG
ncbi:hypothetical protein CDD82_3542 [Ophiocordyceps australis]|uniref:G-protein coupled receptors family 2 profile 2 domain-containing protein n=1 Tax=Ophiocordyceps australis TaxID=1399860 RepID=A0A2C5ZD80_9HYPO|nr:hypothetical protein CDD82_3542 [Ophiocordyceps australis]